jgi:hypothetical protein
MQTLASLLLAMTGDDYSHIVDMTFYWYSVLLLYYILQKLIQNVTFSDKI